MPIITVLAPSYTGFDLAPVLDARSALVETTAAQLNISKDEVTVLFVQTLLCNDDADEVVVYVDLFDKQERTDQIRAHLAKKLGTIVYDTLLKVREQLSCREQAKPLLVEVIVRPFDPSQGFWSSRAA